MIMDTVIVRNSAWSLYLAHVYWPANKNVSLPNTNTPQSIVPPWHWLTGFRKASEIQMLKEKYAILFEFWQLTCTTQSKKAGVVINIAI